MSNKEKQRLDHIFDKKHKLDILVKKYGSRKNALNAIQAAADMALEKKELNPNTKGILPNGDKGDIIDMVGIPVRLIGGKVEDGKVIISSASRIGL